MERSSESNLDKEVARVEALSVGEGGHCSRSQEAADRDWDFAAALVENDAACELEREDDQADVGGQASLDGTEVPLGEKVVLAVLDEDCGEARGH